jgi:hypothetical protein
VLIAVAIPVAVAVAMMLQLSAMADEPAATTMPTATRAPAAAFPNWICSDASSLSDLLMGVPANGTGARPADDVTPCGAIPAVTRALPRNFVIAIHRFKSRR